MMVFEPYSSSVEELRIGDLIYDSHFTYRMSDDHFVPCLIVVGTSEKLVYFFHVDGGFEEHTAKRIDNWTKYGWTVVR